MPRTIGALTAAVTLGVGVVFPAVGQATTGTGIPAHVFAPYFQGYQGVSLANVSRASGARYLTLAFVETPQHGSCSLNWDNNAAKPIAWSTYGAAIAGIRARGGDVIPSFGGKSADNAGRELADSCRSVSKIAAAYEKVITTYKVTRLDMDIEGRSLTNPAGVDRRNKAITIVERWARTSGRKVQFVYSLPTGPAGLGAPAKHLLQNAVANHTRVDVVNIMTFDYYFNTGVAHNMTADTKTAAQALVAFLRPLRPGRSTDQLWRGVGVTEMIGHDDYGSAGEAGPAEVFTLADARLVTPWAMAKHLAQLSFWAVNRDRATDRASHCALGTNGGDYCTGIRQQPWQFTHIMRAFS